MNRAVVSSYTARTTAFATATGITDTTILGALNTFDLGLISNGLDTKMKAVYPFVGGSASTNKYNFFDARDLDIAYRLTFAGGWTHNSNGVTPNGTNAYANTNFKPSNSTYTNFSFGYNLKSNTYGYLCEFGLNDSGRGYKVHDFPYSDVAGNGFTAYGTGDVINYVDTSVASFITFTQFSNQLKRFENGTLINTVSNTPPNLSLTTLNYFISARNLDGSAQFYSNRAKNFQFISDGLTDAESLTFRNLVNNMQITLGR